MKKIKLIFTLGISLLVSSLMMPVASAAPRYVGAPISWSWTTEDWGGNDKPYLAARKSIGKLYKQKKLTDAGLAKYKKAAFARQADPLTRFKWAYYAYCYALLQPDIFVGSGKLGDVEKAFRFEKSPGSYQYTRLHYLVLSYLTHSGDELRYVGNRLLKRDPKDVSVKYVQVTHLRNGTDREGQFALQYAEQLVKLNPKEGAYYALLGETHSMLLFGKNPRGNVKDAIANYRRYLSLSKLSDAQRKRVEKTIRDLPSFAKRIRENQA